MRKKKRDHRPRNNAQHERVVELLSMHKANRTPRQISLLPSVSLPRSIMRKLGESDQIFQVVWWSTLVVKPTVTTKFVSCPFCLVLTHTSKISFLRAKVNFQKWPILFTTIYNQYMQASNCGEGGFCIQLMHASNFGRIVDHNCRQISLQNNPTSPDLSCDHVFFSTVVRNMKKGPKTNIKGLPTKLHLRLFIFCHRLSYNLSKFSIPVFLFEVWKAWFFRRQQFINPKQNVYPGIISSRIADPGELFSSILEPAHEARPGQRAALSVQAGTIRIVFTSSSCKRGLSLWITSFSCILVMHKKKLWFTWPFSKLKWNAHAHSFRVHLQHFRSPRSYHAHALFSFAKSSLTHLDRISFRRVNINF